MGQYFKKGTKNNKLLDIYCNFSSNNNIWAWFYVVFVAAILNFAGLFLLWQTDRNFAYEFFGILNLNSDFKV